MKMTHKRPKSYMFILHGHSFVISAQTLNFQWHIWNGIRSLMIYIFLECKINCFWTSLQIKASAKSRNRSHLHYSFTLACLLASCSSSSRWIFFFFFHFVFFLNLWFHSWVASSSSSSSSSLHRNFYSFLLPKHVSDAACEKDVK